jgi:hypothetical protein
MCDVLKNNDISDSQGYSLQHAVACTGMYCTQATPVTLEDVLSGTRYR